MWSKIGISCILIGFFIGVFTGISKFMQADNMWVDMTLSTVTGAFGQKIVDLIPVAVVQETLYYLVYEVHVGWIVVGLSPIFFLISIFAKEY